MPIKDQSNESTQRCFPAEHTLITPTPQYSQKVQERKDGLLICDPIVAFASLQFL